ncbi:S-layer homology domain-containing protein, partial [Candidatus Peregrinibacteria bacterium]|nr:S-layer homology domain-containing protein [Candidatus Peregrinibacteria bacterium]
GAFSGGVSIIGGGASINIVDSILSNNTPANCTGAGIISFGGNIESANDCNFIAPTDLINTDPLLTLVDINTFLDFPSNNSYLYSLQAGSPAIDHAVGSVGLDQRGTVRPVDGDGNGSALPDSGAIELNDFISPVLNQITPVPTPANNPTPSYTFSSSEAGTISYGGACSSPSLSAVAGNNTIIFNPLPVGIYSSCTITVTDLSLNASLPLTINTFEILAAAAPVVDSGGGGSASFGKPACSGNQCNGQTNTTVETTSAPDNSSSLLPFTDIKGHWAENYINNLHQACGINGFKDANGNLLHLFKPDQPITRAELLAMLYQCQQKSNSENIAAELKATSFPDAKNHWASSYIYAYEWLLTGYPDGTFKPDQNINRAEAVKVLMLTFFKADQITGANSSCRDIVPNSWYAKYFEFALNHGIVQGYADPVGTCAPAWNISRAEVAKIITLSKSVQVQP